MHTHIHSDSVTHPHVCKAGALGSARIGALHMSAELFFLSNFFSKLKAKCWSHTESAYCKPSFPAIVVLLVAKVWALGAAIQNFGNVGINFGKLEGYGMLHTLDVCARSLYLHSSLPKHVGAAELLDRSHCRERFCRSTKRTCPLRSS